MMEFSIVAFDIIGLAFVRQGDVDSRRVQQRLVGVTGITVVQHSLRRGIQHGLPVRLITLECHSPTDNATGRPFYQS